MYKNDLITAKKELETVFPDLNINDISFMGEGWTCHGFLVNGEIVFKIPQKPEYASAIETEILALEALDGKINAPIPKILYKGHLANGLPVIGESLIPGKVIHAQGYENLSHLEQDNLLMQLGSVVKELQSVPVNHPAFQKPTLETVLETAYKNYSELNKKELSKKEQAEIPELFASYEETYDKELFRPVFSQGDIYVENIMFDEKTKKMTGLIDFGLAGFTDPYDDLHHFWHYDHETLGKYAGLEMGKKGKTRVLFYAMADLLGSLNFLEKQGKDGNEWKPYLHKFIKDFNILKTSDDRTKSFDKNQSISR